MPTRRTWEVVVMKGTGLRLRTKRSAALVALGALVLVGTAEYAVLDRPSSAKPALQTPSGCLADLQKTADP